MFDELRTWAKKQHVQPSKQAGENGQKTNIYKQLLSKNNMYVFIICLAQSMSRKDKVNPAFWLATWAGKTAPSISHVGPQVKVLFLAT